MFELVSEISGRDFSDSTFYGFQQCIMEEDVLKLEDTATITIIIIIIIMIKK